VSHWLRTSVPPGIVFGRSSLVHDSDRIHWGFLDLPGSLGPVSSGVQVQSC